MPTETAVETAVFIRVGVQWTHTLCLQAVRSGKRHLISVSRANARRFTMTLRDEYFARVAARFPDVATERMLVNAMAARLVLSPERVGVSWPPICSGTY